MTFNKELWTSMLPLYLMKPSFLNLFIKKLTRDRVVPIISASVSMRELRIDWQQDLVTVGGEFDGVFNPLASTEQMNRSPPFTQSKCAAGGFWPCRAPGAPAVRFLPLGTVLESAPMTAGSLERPPILGKT